MRKLNLSRRVVALIVGALFLCLGIFCIYIEAYTLHRVRSAQNWPTVPGYIIEATYVSADSYVIRFQYEIHGIMYSNDRVLPSVFADFHDVSSRDGGLALTLIDHRRKSHFLHFKKGDEVRVYFNPRDPRDAVLIPHAPSMRMYSLFGIAVSLVFILAFILSLRPDTATDKAALMRQ